jgi:hypothetical protein
VYENYQDAIEAEEAREALVAELNCAIAKQTAEIERERRNPLLRWYRRIVYGAS